MNKLYKVELILSQVLGWEYITQSYQVLVVLLQRPEAS